MSQATLLLRCSGPMQSWGTRSRFGERDTERTPSKSGICGLLAAAQGRPRDADLSDLASLRMAVRIDRAGHVESDYQTAGGGTWTNGQRYGVAKASGATPDTMLSRRYFLADADFLVGLEGPRTLLATLQDALRAPRWPLFLGRRGYAPGQPVHLPDGVVDKHLLDALRDTDWPLDREGTPVGHLLAEVECGPDEAGDLRRDVPVSFVSADRRYVERRVRRVRLRHKET